MQAALRFTTVVGQGGKIEINAPELPAGESVDVIILFPERPMTERRSAVDILSEAPGRQIFRTAQEVDAYLQEERNAWDRSEGIARSCAETLRL